jgi:hypothetical protein
VSSDLLAQAFAALGPGPTQRELELVAEALRDSGDEDAIAILEAPGRDEFRALAELASASGSSAFVALDLATAIANPGAPPVRGSDRRAGD